VPVFGPGLPRRTSDADVALAVVLDDELQDLKLAARPGHPEPSMGGDFHLERGSEHEPDRGPP
jgi:hypothetical protein